MLFYSFFKSLVGKDVVVELKNDLSICGTLHSVDQYLNIKLTDISVTDPEKYPHMLSVKNCFIRGSVVRYVQLPGDEVDTQLLQDAARKEAVTSNSYVHATIISDGDRSTVEIRSIHPYNCSALPDTSGYCSINNSTMIKQLSPLSGDPTG
ncbi:U6 snRNA-associated Sm-like protein LSm2 isoform X1 [Toxorhynchites rutilus septentrionalis]|uniref:U6 snRNA-associated Sm-like protein LSm2 isoform X1 n=1 Tax=Toxorhynchites rutilus septentrionalis TaxID=329112 RepID=UPI00247AD44C|nr:U6 snRNA-associated Sm-like protein LSm2 isoform X1 [Toxorhynchites rutilus septentrionalis]